MQNKLYTVRFSHRSTTNLQPVPEEQSWNLQITDFANFMKLLKKIELPEKSELPDQRGFDLKEKRRAESCPSANLHS